MLLSSRSRGRIALATALTAAFALFAPGVAHAAPPSNDDFDQAAAVTALPFTAQQDSSEATQAPDDPSWCQPYDVRGSVWFRYTATEDGYLRATTQGSDRSMILAVHSGTRGTLRGITCDSGTAATTTFRATAGTTYSFMVSGYDVPGGALAFALDSVAPAANDDFAAAQPVPAVPFSAQPDFSVASYEADEPGSTCQFEGNLVPSVWYAYTNSGAAKPVTARTVGSGSAVSVYTGASLPELKQVACKADAYGQPTAFRADAGATYYVRVTGPADNRGPVTLTLDDAPALDPSVDQSPSYPTVYDTVSFSAGSWNDIDEPMTVAWDFGDGATAPATTQPVSHRYAKDGTYTATLHATSPDGRTATKTAQVVVTTHDVGIARFSVPASAREGDSKPISVDVSNTRYTETATVVLSKHDGTWWREVGRLTLEVPARPTRTVRFPFSYTFSPDDAALGKVAFRAELKLDYPVTDARPADNEVIAIATTVKPRGSRVVAV
ncbi:PKD domain-containing protein [Amycolatopsis mongoliensis]|uniref:PKD domain-containing protein n=1 Tax=Amycolatopsis mongoliensis TaxID=715475 RepID=A0A9Y2JZX5_9PSEU|nr:PKD domain-containing protein [Amycolatopsis sp. 4-36]WIY06592.1 PKD domain-containing protein [Amycolatopsis sp. 4-36]